MGSRAQDMDYRGPVERGQADHCVDAWLHRSLQEQYRQIVQEPLPNFLLDMLPPD